MREANPFLRSVLAVLIFFACSVGGAFLTPYVLARPLASDCDGDPYCGLAALMAGGLVGTVAGGLIGALLGLLLGMRWWWPLLLLAALPAGALFTPLYILMPIVAAFSARPRGSTEPPSGYRHHVLIGLLVLVLLSVAAVGLGYLGKRSEITRLGLPVYGHADMENAKFISYGRGGGKLSYSLNLEGRGYLQVQMSNETALPKCSGDSTCTTVGSTTVSERSHGALQARRDAGKVRIEVTVSDRDARLWTPRKLGQFVEEMEEKSPDWYVRRTP